MWWNRKIEMVHWWPAMQERWSVMLDESRHVEAIYAGQDGGESGKEVMWPDVDVGFRILGVEVPVPVPQVPVPAYEDCPWREVHEGRWKNLVDGGSRMEVNPWREVSDVGSWEEICNEKIKKNYFFDVLFFYFVQLVNKPPLVGGFVFT